MKTILIVEDDASIRECLVQLLQFEGYQVNTACHGKEALEYLEKSPHPCLIFLDLMMPVMNGWEFLEKLQEMEHCHHVSVVISSAVAEDAKMKGAVAVLKKPYQIEAVLSLVHQYCNPDS